MALSVLKRGVVGGEPFGQHLVGLACNPTNGAGPYSLQFGGHTDEQGAVREDRPKGLGREECGSVHSSTFRAGVDDRTMAEGEGCRQSSPDAACPVVLHWARAT